VYEAAGSAPCNLVKRVLEEVDSLPDVREERVAAARALLDSDLPDSEELAAKLIGRAVSDAIR